MNQLLILICLQNGPPSDQDSFSNLSKRQRKSARKHSLRTYYTPFAGIPAQTLLPYSRRCAPLILGPLRLDDHNFMEIAATSCVDNNDACGGEVIKHYIPHGATKHNSGPESGLVLRLSRHNPQLERSVRNGGADRRG